MVERFENLDDVFRSVWNLLFRATVQSKDPFRTPVLATVTADAPTARTVVLRASDSEKRSLFFYTDYRTPKVIQLKTNPAATAVFWNPNRKVQLRTSGQIEIHHQNETTLKHWQQIPTRNRKDYASIVEPSQIQNDPDDYLPAYWNTEELTHERTESHYPNFVVLQLIVTEIDWLHLNRAGHRRALFCWDNENWEKNWLVP